MHRGFVKQGEGESPQCIEEKGGQDVNWRWEPRARWGRASNPTLQGSDLILNHGKPTKVF